MPSYTLRYFDARGRAEPTRMLFALANQKYTDDRFSREEWATLKEDKKKFPLGQSPVFEVDGTVIPHSKAIAKYVATELGLYGENSLEAAKMDVVIETMSDIELKMLPLFLEHDEEKKAELRKKFREETSKPLFNFLCELLKESGGRYFVGNKPSVADVSMFNFLDIITSGTFQVDGLLDPYPELQEYVRHFREESPLKEYLANRKETAM